MIMPLQRGVVVVVHGTRVMRPVTLTLRLGSRQWKRTKGVQVREEKRRDLENSKGRKKERRRARLRGIHRK